MYGPGSLLAKTLRLSMNLKRVMSIILQIKHVQPYTSLNLGDSVNMIAACISYLLYPCQPSVGEPSKRCTYREYRTFRSRKSSSGTEMGTFEW